MKKGRCCLAWLGVGVAELDNLFNPLDWKLDYSLKAFLLLLFLLLSRGTHLFPLTTKVQIWGINCHSRYCRCCCCCCHDESKFSILYYMLFHCLIEFQFFFPFSSISNWDFNYTLKASNHQLVWSEDLSLVLSFTSFEFGWSIRKLVWFGSLLFLSGKPSFIHFFLPSILFSCLRRWSGKRKVWRVSSSWKSHHLNWEITNFTSDEVNLQIWG